MTPAAARLAHLATEATPAEPPEERAPPAEVFEPEPDPTVREAVATAEPPEPTVFVSREWNETAEAVAQAYRGPAEPAAQTTTQSDPGRTAALIGGALGLVLFLLVMRRGGHHQLADD